jgi:dihydrofolate synthase / folylpolyglutamate synthase
MKTINQYFDYLYSLERVGMKYDLSNITKLLKALGNPHKQFKSIHIAGTNGKGATASFTASILQEQGCKTGLFTSPHLLKFNERIRINGKCISDSYIRKFLNENIKLIGKVKPSFFEVNTALAFKYFAENKVDAAVVECGLGGRLDSTNTLTPEVCVITQIGIDHTQFLGNTLGKIAKEKAGILKKCSSVIISDTNRSLRSLFRKRVTWQKKIFLDEFLDIKTGKPGFSLIFKPKKQKLNFTIPVKGEYQARNAATALIAAIGFSKKAGQPLHFHHVEQGFKNVRNNTGYRGRLDLIRSGGQSYIFDISHNAQGINSALKELRPGSKDIVVFGIMADKDYKKALKELLTHRTNIIFTKPSYQRALEPEVLYNLGVRYKGGKRGLKHFSNIYEALAQAKNSVKPQGRIIVLGSFFMVHDAVKALKLEKHFE